MLDDLSALASKSTLLFRSCQITVINKEIHDLIAVPPANSWAERFWRAQMIGVWFVYMTWQKFIFNFTRVSGALSFGILRKSPTAESSNVDVVPTGISSPLRQDLCLLWDRTSVSRAGWHSVVSQFRGLVLFRVVYNCFWTVANH